MKSNWIISLALTFSILTGCGSENNANALNYNGSASRITVSLDQAKYFDAAGVALLEKARAALQNVLNSVEFKNQVLNYSFVQNDGLSNLQIYEKIMRGAEVFPAATPIDHVMNLFYQLYTSEPEQANVIGYTNPGTKTIYLNSYYFNGQATVEGIAGNMMHEWLHKIGFDHDFEPTERRPHSVPYAIGYIVQNLVKSST